MTTPPANPTDTLSANKPLDRVADASVLIVLAKIGRLDLLTAEGRRVFITETVYQEVLAGDAHDPARLALVGGFGQRTPDAAVPQALTALPEWKTLDAGEEATLALALHIGAAAAIDDGDARRAARALGIVHVGTSGLAVEGKRLGIVTSAAGALRQLAAVNVYLPRENVLQALLSTVGETWA